MLLCMGKTFSASLKIAYITSGQANLMGAVINVLNPGESTELKIAVFYCDKK